MQVPDGVDGVYAWCVVGAPHTDLGYGEQEAGAVYIYAYHPETDTWEGYDLLHDNDIEG
ncbi:hypothetical protein KIPB_013948, partial [Kipferlia bialata]|eukprot:g13948.t1